MPGKVNPVVPEVANLVTFEIVGHDLAITMAAEGGQFQLNAFEPRIAFSLFRSVSHLRAAVETLAKRCIDGITVNRQRIEATVERSAVAATALVPLLGYATSAELAKESLSTGRGVGEIAVERGLISRRTAVDVLSPHNLAGRPLAGETTAPGEVQSAVRTAKVRTRTPAVLTFVAEGDPHHRRRRPCMEFWTCLHTAFASAPEPRN